MSFHQQIMKHVSRTKGGQLLLPTDFRGLGTDTAIKMSLSRISREGIIIRLCHGIYFKSKKGMKNSQFEMDAHEVAKMISIKENVRICPSERYALYLLGLIKLKPNELTFVTDGEPRRLNIQDSLIIFKPTTPRKLSISLPVIALLVQAFEFLGKNNIDADTLEKIKEKLRDQNEKTLMPEIAKAPAWIYNLLFKLLKDKN